MQEHVHQAAPRSNSGRTKQAPDSMTTPTMASASTAGNHTGVKRMFGMFDVTLGAAQGELGRYGSEADQYRTRAVNPERREAARVESKPAAQKSESAEDTRPVENKQVEQAALINAQSPVREQKAPDQPRTDSIRAETKLAQADVDRESANGRRQTVLNSKKVELARPEQKRETKVDDGQSLAKDVTIHVKASDVADDARKLKPHQQEKRPESLRAWAQEPVKDARARRGSDDEPDVSMLARKKSEDGKARVDQKAPELKKAAVAERPDGEGRDVKSKDKPLESRADATKPLKPLDAQDLQSKVRQAAGEAREAQESSDDVRKSAGAKKEDSKGVRALEELTGLKARAGVEIVAPLAAAQVQTADASLAAKAIATAAVDGVKAAPPAQTNGQLYQNQADQRQSAKLPQQARQLASYVTGKPLPNVNVNQTFSDLVSKAKLFVDNGKSEMTIQLKPEHLGRLTIQMSVEDGKMAAQFTTDRADVKALIEQNADQLKARLAESGIEISQMQVEVRSESGQNEPAARDGLTRRTLTFDDGVSGGQEKTDVELSGDMAYAKVGYGSRVSLVA